MLSIIVTFPVMTRLKCLALENLGVACSRKNDSGA